MPVYTITWNLGESSVDSAAEMVLGRQPVRNAVKELKTRGYDAYILKPDDLDLFTSTTLRMDRVDTEAISILQKYGLAISSL